MVYLRKYDIYNCTVLDRMHPRELEKLSGTNATSSLSSLKICGNQIEVKCPICLQKWKEGRSRELL